MSQGFLTSCRGFMFSWRQNKCSTEKHQDVELPVLWTRRSRCFLTVSLTGLLSEMSFLSIISRQKKVFFVLMCFKTQSFSNIRGESRLKTTKRLSSQSEDQHRNCTLTFLLNLREASRCSNPPRVSGRRLMNLRHHDNSSTVTAR